jgi:hypothetical protein
LTAAGRPVICEDRIERFRTEPFEDEVRLVGIEEPRWSTKDAEMPAKFDEQWQLSPRDVARAIWQTTEPPDGKYTQALRAILDAKLAEATLQSMDATRIAAEANRLTYEATRQAAEATRLTFEATRQAAEASRATAQATMAAAQASAATARWTRFVAGATLLLAIATVAVAIVAAIR